MIFGTWADDLGNSGSWQAELGLATEAAVVSLDGAGDVLLDVQEEGGIGSATYYGTDNGIQSPTVTGCDITTDMGTLQVVVDEVDQETESHLGSVRVVLSFNIDGSVDYEVYEEENLVYSGDGIAGNGGSTPAPISASAESPVYFVVKTSAIHSTDLDIHIKNKHSHICDIGVS